MYANSALAFTGTGVSVAASAALPSGSDLAAADATAGEVAVPAVEAARVLLAVTGVGFGVFLLAMVALLIAGAVLRGGDAARRRLAARSDSSDRSDSNSDSDRSDRHGDSDRSDLAAGVS